MSARLTQLCSARCSNFASKYNQLQQQQEEQGQLVKKEQVEEHVKWEKQGEHEEEEQVKQDWPFCHRCIQIESIVLRSLLHWSSSNHRETPFLQNTSSR